MHTLTIVLPTIAGREAERERTIAAYERLTPCEIQWVHVYDYPTCAEAWNAGASAAEGRYLHMGADDIEPETGAWFAAATSVVDAGGVPLGWVREDVQGVFGRDFCRAVFCLREWWHPVPPVHYYSDNAFDDLMRVSGHTPTVAEGFDFYHRKSMVGRDESPERLARDYSAYQAYRREL